MSDLERATREPLWRDGLDGRLSRRELIRRVTALGLSTSTVAAFLAACGGTATPNVQLNPTATAASGRGATTTAAPGAGTAGSPGVSGGRIPAPAAKKELVIVQGADITQLNPQLSTSANDTNITFNLYDNLLYRDADGKLQPMLATEYKAVDDTTWEFKLRQGVKFHNGDPFTAADVKFTAERAVNPDAKTLVSAVYGTVASVEAPDDFTVRFKMKAPDPLLPARLAFYGGQIMPARYFESTGADGFNQKPVGTGPLKFVEWIKDDRVVFDANKEYWGGTIALDRVVFRPRKEVASRVSALLNGEADIALSIPPDQLEGITKGDKTRIESALYGGLYVLAVNSKQGVLGKPEVKQALTYAVDRKAIIDTIWRGQGIIPSGMIPKGSFAFDEKLAPLAYDPNKAKELLKAAGYNNEEIIIESTQGYVENDKQMAEAIIQMWKDAGVNVKVEIIEVSVRAQKNREKSFKGLFWSDPTDTLGDPAGMSWRLLGPGGVQDYWRDARWDELGVEANATLDQEKRKKNYDEMNQIFLKNLPWIPIIQPNQAYGLANYVEWRPYSSTYFNLRKENLKLVR